MRLLKYQSIFIFVVLLIFGYFGKEETDSLPMLIKASQKKIPMH
jgi:hypothetical protein